MKQEMWSIEQEIEVLRLKLKHLYYNNIKDEQLVHIRKTLTTLNRELPPTYMEREIF